MKKNNKKAFSSIIALLMIGFLLILTIGTFNLVLKELFDNKSLGKGIKAYAGAQGAAELALLTIKDKGYGFDDKIDNIINNRSIILSKDPINISNFKKASDTIISYNLNTKVNFYKGKLNSLGYDIIPLFYLTGSNTIILKKVNAIALDILSGNPSDISWNIISDTSGLSGLGKINNSTIGKGRKLDYFIEKNVNLFLSNSLNKTNYILLFNSGNSTIDYKIQSLNLSEYFSKPRTEIIASGKVGGYKQNIRITLDNTKYLNILKYSIYGN